MFVLFFGTIIADVIVAIAFTAFKEMMGDN